MHHQKLGPGACILEQGFAEAWRSLNPWLVRASDKFGKPWARAELKLGTVQLEEREPAADLQVFMHIGCSVSNLACVNLCSV